jgi:hypothetical protein
MEARTPVNQDNPKPYRSPLWAHLDEIQQWRLAQDTWEAIAERLTLQHGLKISFQAVHAFFKRASKRRGRRPLGFVAQRSNSIAIQTTVTLAQGADSIYEEARQTIRQEQQSKPKIIKPDRPL